MVDISKVKGTKWLASSTQPHDCGNDWKGTEYLELAEDDNSFVWKDSKTVEMRSMDWEDTETIFKRSGSSNTSYIYTIR